MAYNYFSIEDSKLKWRGNLETLKSFISNELNLTGKWTSPGGDVKAFTNDDGYITEDETIKIKWYQGKKILTVQGVKSQDIEDKIHVEIQKISHTGEGESKDEQDKASLDQTALNQTELQHLHSEKLIEAINDIKGQIHQLKVDTKENQTSISKLMTLSQVAHPKPDNESLELHKLRQENDEYRRQNENLLRENVEKTERMNNLAYILSDLNTKIKILEDEKASLVTAISLLNDEYRQKEHAHDQSSTVNKQNDWTTVKGPKDGVASTVRADSNDHDCYVVENSNRYTTLNDEVCGNNSNSKNKDHPDASECNRDTSSITSKIQKRKKKKKTVVIAGDSMVKNVIGAKMSSVDTDNFFVVKPFPGATVQDMNDFINPLIRKKPDKMILHIGTNDLKSSRPKVVAESILKLVTRIKEASPNTAVGISALLVRNDNHELAVKVNLVNDILRDYSINANISYLANANINSSHLNSRGLHLNSIGSSILQDNFREFANNILN